jgi:hypothetical protein
MANIGNIGVKISANAEEFVAAVDHAAHKAHEFGGEILRIFGGGGLLVGAGSVVGFVEMIKHTTEEMVMLDKQAQRLGYSTETFSALLAKAGPYAESTAHGLTVLSRTFGEMQAGSTAAAEKLDRFFGRVGAARELAGGGMENFLGAVADKLASIKDPAERAAAGFELGGRRGQMMAEMLKDGAASLDAIREKMKLQGVAFSHADVEELHHAHDAMLDIERTIKGVRNQLAIQLSPIVRDIAEGFASWTTKAGGIGPAMMSVAETIADVIDVVVRDIRKVIGEIRQLTKAPGELAAGAAKIAAMGIAPGAGVSLGRGGREVVGAEGLGLGDRIREFNAKRMQGGHEAAAAGTAAAEAMRLMDEASQKLAKDLQHQILMLGMTADQQKVFKLSMEGATQAQLQDAASAAAHAKSLDEVFKGTYQAVGIFEKFAQQRHALQDLGRNGVETSGAMQKLNDDFERLKQTAAGGIFQRTLTELEKFQSSVGTTLKLLDQGFFTENGQVTAGLDLLSQVEKLVKSMPNVAAPQALAAGSAAEASFRSRFERGQAGNDPVEQLKKIQEILSRSDEVRKQIGAELLKAIQEQELVGVSLS